MKKFIIIALSLVFLGTGCSANIYFDKPQVPSVKITATVTHLTPEEFDRVGTSGIENPTIDDFRNFQLKVKITNCGRVTKKELEVPGIQEFRQVLKDRWWFGSYGYQNNESEAFSTAELDCVFYYRNLTDEEFKELLEPLEIRTSWVNSKGEKTAGTYKLTDYLEFR